MAIESSEVPSNLMGWMVILWPIIVGIITFFAAWWRTNKTTEAKLNAELRKSKNEKLWDIKRERYEQLLIAVDAYFFAVNQFNYSVQRRDLYDESYLKNRMDDINTTYNKVTEINATNKLYFSPSIYEFIDEYIKNKCEIDHAIFSAKSLSEVIEAGTNIYSEIHPSLSEMQNELVKAMRVDLSVGDDYSL